MDMRLKMCDVRSLYETVSLPENLKGRD